MYPILNRLNASLRSLLLVICCLLASVSYSQKVSPADKKILNAKEDTLKELSRRMVFAEQAGDRFRSDSIFIRTFVRALRTTNSFFYPFDSLSISKLYAPDSSFRIFTWQMKKDEYVLLQKGAIQMRTRDGSLKLYPLFDNSMFTSRPNDSLRSAQNWIGAIYYRIIKKTHNGKNYYTLLGFDDFSVSSNKKWMDILHFDNNGAPQFGGQMISFKNDSVKRPTQARFSIEYKKEAKTYFNYDSELDLIIVDHLISESDEPEKKSTYVPDGDYEAFKWENGQWVHIDKLFNEKLKDGEFPKEALLLDDEGKADEKKLEEASRKTFEKEQQKNNPPKKNEPPKKKTGGN